MFRMLKLSPPHGWRAVAWELAIVTSGVLIALAVQQWADRRGSEAKARNATGVLRDEVKEHYIFAVEWRRVEPCIYQQIDRLAERLIAGGERIDPAPVYSEPGFDAYVYVLRLPSRAYNLSSWQAAISDGVTTYLDRDVRRELNTHYARVAQLNEGTALNNAAYPQLFGLSRSLPLDSASRLTFLRTLDELRGRVEYMSLLSRQTIANIEQAGLTPDKAEVARRVEQVGTVKFCKRQSLRLRPVADSLTSNPN